MPTATSKATKSQISQYMSNIGRKGGKLGGKRSLETMSPAARSDRAKAAVNERWARYYKENPDKVKPAVKAKAKPKAKKSPAKRKRKKPARKRS